LKAGQAVVVDHAEQQLPTFARASRNMAIAATLLDMLPTPSTDGVGEVYQWLKNIISTAAAQQVESSIQHQVEASISTNDRSNVGGQGAAQDGNDFLTGEDFSQRPVGPTWHLVKTSGTMTALPRGRRRAVPFKHVEPTPWSPRQS
jgi:hypothetical protein